MCSEQIPLMVKAWPGNELDFFYPRKLWESILRAKFCYYSLFMSPISNIFKCFKFSLCMCRGQRITGETHFSVSTMWVMGSVPGLQAW